MTSFSVDELSRLSRVCDSDFDGGLSYAEFHDDLCIRIQYWYFGTTLNETSFNTVDANNDNCIDGTELPSLEDYFECKGDGSLDQRELCDFIHINFCTDCDEDDIADTVYGDLSNAVCPHFNATVI